MLWQELSWAGANATTDLSASKIGLLWNAQPSPHFTNQLQDRMSCWLVWIRHPGIAVDRSKGSIFSCIRIRAVWAIRKGHTQGKFHIFTSWSCSSRWCPEESELRCWNRPIVCKWAVHSQLLKYTRRFKVIMIAVIVLVPKRQISFVIVVFFAFVHEDDDVIIILLIPYTMFHFSILKSMS